MMTADFGKARLSWNSSVVDGSKLRATGGKLKKKKKPSVDTSGLVYVPESTQSSLDSMIAAVDASEIIPELGSGAVKKPRPTRVNIDRMDEAAAKYGIVTTKKSSGKSPVVGDSPSYGRTTGGVIRLGRATRAVK